VVLSPVIAGEATNGKNTEGCVIALSDIYGLLPPNNESI
jgi:hypothetical protein